MEIRYFVLSIFMIVFMCLLMRILLQTHVERIVKKFGNNGNIFFYLLGLTIMGRVKKLNVTAIMCILCILIGVVLSFTLSFLFVIFFNDKVIPRVLMLIARGYLGFLLLIMFIEAVYLNLKYRD